MAVKDLKTMELPAAADMHVHLRQGPMMELVVPEIRKGGVNTVFVMPNLTPPITTVKQALEYKSQLQALEPNVHSSITPDVIAEAAAAGITGVKVYPQGVTTNSTSGVTDLTAFFPVFEAMEKQNLVLNLHGEVPNSTEAGITVMNAEEAFLPTLCKIHEAFPKLRIILEHCTTAAALSAVQKCGPTVAATITAHHLYLTQKDWCHDHNPFAFCKPVPKLPVDRDALCAAAISGNPKFFFGSDSAPHPLTAKAPGEDGDATKAAAGVYTQSCAVQLVVRALEDAVERGVVRGEDVTEEKLAGFLSAFGRKFYGGEAEAEDRTKEKIRLTRGGFVVPERIRSEDGGVEVAVSRAGEEVWGLEWV